MVHIGIIPDGNRRWFKKNNFDYKNINQILKVWFNKFLKLLNSISILKNNDELFKIKSLTFYVCSIDNMYREDATKEHILAFLDLLLNFYKNYEEIINNYPDLELENKKLLLKYLNDLLKNLNICIVGDIDILPDKLKCHFKEFNSKYDKSKPYNLYLGIAYDFKKDLLNFGLQNNENYIREQSNLDIILRTGGEFRVSGFFPCHNNYAEIFILDKYWPEIEIANINSVIYDFLFKRNRRFGK